MGGAVAVVDKIDWVADYIVPHEAQLRRWLRKFVAWSEVEDIVQEAFCDIAALDSVTHIHDPRRYLFQVARNIVKENLRRAQIVQIEAIGGVHEIEDLTNGEHDPLSPERFVADRAWLARIDALVATLPERAAKVFQLRKVQGLPQREVAESLGVTEAVVQNDLTRGFRAILRALSDDERAELSSVTKERNHGGPRKR